MVSVERSRSEPFAIVLALLMVLPVLALVVLGLGRGNSWPQLFSTTLPRLLYETVLLCSVVGIATLLLGTIMAWLITFYDFPLRRSLSWMAVLPLAIPGYILAFVMVDTFSYAGPVQTMLRGWMGWTTPSQSLIPEIRNHWGAAFVLSLALYPYVYLSARAGFLKQSMRQVEVARTLGRTPLQAFLQITLPQARPALAVGVALVLMECLNDIGAVGFFGVNTLTYGIYTTWLEKGDLATASQLALSMLAGLALLLWFEQAMRQREQSSRAEKNIPPMTPITLTGWRAAFAIIGISLPIAIGFVLPVLLLVSYATGHWASAITEKLAHAMWNSVLLAALSCLAALGLALLFGFAARGRARHVLNAVRRVASWGYAIPGTVLAIGVLMPFAAADHALNAVAKFLWGIGPGLIFSGTITALVFAYVVRFLIMATGQIDSGFDKISLHLDQVARTLGRTPVRVFREIHIPLLIPALLSAALLIIVEAIKELPATLILRPFDFETLATHTYSLASLGLLEDSAVPALVIVAVGLVPVILLTRGLERA
jgi:iron(III) transport system permease protein